MIPPPVHLGFVGLGIEIQSNSPDANALIMVNFSALRSEYSKEADLVYEITENDKGFVIRRSKAMDLSYCQRVIPRNFYMF